MGPRKHIKCVEACHALTNSGVFLYLVTFIHAVKYTFLTPMTAVILIIATTENKNVLQNHIV